VNCAAFGNLSRDEYAIHLVNNGAARKATVKGLPKRTERTAYVTSQSLDMQQTACVQNDDGSITIDLPATAFVTVIIR
jgi:hypothetical protein